MSTNRPPLTDGLLRQALVELGAGQDDGELLSDVMRAVDASPQVRGLPWPGRWSGRQLALIAATALLLMAIAGGVAVLTGILPAPRPLPFVPHAIVTEQSNNERGAAFQITHTAFAFGSNAGVTLPALPANAIAPRWSPDGIRVSYFTQEAPENTHGMPITGLYVADPDGNNPIAVDLPRAPSQYMTEFPVPGGRWAPSGATFAISWTTGGCSGGPDCLPETGIDVFDPTGTLVAVLPTPGQMSGQLLWSPDSTRVGWLSGSCVDGICNTDTVNIRPTDGSEGAVALPLEPFSTVGWSESNRLVVVDGMGEDGTGGQAYSMAPDGSDRVDFAWSASDLRWPAWSPDGRRLVSALPNAGQLIIRDAESGEDVLLTIPTGLGPFQWSPEGDRIVLLGDGDPYEFSVVNVDGTGLLKLGSGQDIAWMPNVPSSAPGGTQPASIPDASPTTSTTIQVDFPQPFSYVAPTGTDLRFEPQGMTDPSEWYAYAVGSDHGIDVILVNGYIHPCLALFPAPTPTVDGGTAPFDTFFIRTSPADYLADLAQIAGVGIGSISAITLDGYEGAAAAFDPAQGACTGTRMHANGLGPGGVEPTLDTPARLIVAAIGNGSLDTVGIRIWAKDAATLDDWMPTAQEFVQSIHFSHTP